MTIKATRLSKCLPLGITASLLNYGYQMIPEIDILSHEDTGEWVHNGNGSRTIGGSSSVDHNLHITNEYHDDWSSP